MNLKELHPILLNLLNSKEEIVRRFSDYILSISARDSYQNYTLLKRLKSKNPQFRSEAAASIERNLEKEIDLEKRKLILRNINLVCEKILSLDNEDLPLTLAMESEFDISHDIAVDLIIATKFGMDSVLDTTDKFRFQKMISVVSVILESK
jgi:hypothetical protein